MTGIFFASTIHFADAEVMNVELKRLGQLLHERFELEDCLIEVLHNAHRQQATATPL